MADTHTYTQQPDIRVRGALVEMVCVPGAACEVAAGVVEIDIALGLLQDLMRKSAL
jgi:hypothetical protein